MPMIVKEPESVRFARFVDRSGAQGACWPWTGYVMKNGYGTFGRTPPKTTPRTMSPKILAHRMAWILAHGSVPDGQMVLHRCDNRRCVRLSHLFLGTAKVNTQDMIAKGRNSRGDAHWARTRRAEFIEKVSVGARKRMGERHGNAKLTEAKVREIRERRVRGETYKTLAAAFGVCSQAIAAVVRREVWKHVA